MVTSFTINRATWLNGSIPDASAMRDPKNRMCCLGFYGKACGLKPTQMNDIGYPHQVTVPLPAEMAWLVSTQTTDGFNGVSTDEARMLVAANDNDAGTRRGREADVRRLFGRRDIKVTFTGKYPAKKKRAT